MAIAEEPRGGRNDNWARHSGGVFARRVKVVMCRLQGAVCGAKPVLHYARQQKMGDFDHWQQGSTGTRDEEYRTFDSNFSRNRFL
jgi:hypothetical protein